MRASFCHRPFSNLVIRLTRLIPHKTVHGEEVGLIVGDWVDVVEGDREGVGVGVDDGVNDGE